MTSPAAGEIILENATRTFSIRADRGGTLKEKLLGRRADGPEPVRALDGVSLRIAPGETVGIVGRNGAGKSSTLRVLAGIVPLHAGRVVTGGSVVSLLELGAGFGRDFSGRENILLNGALHGLRREEIEARMDAIVAFSELGSFIDVPVKAYSSGMFVRLGFAIAAHLDADTLLIDEVLAVGDASFQQKCFDEFGRIRRSGTTVLLVTHDMGAVERFCDRAMLLEHGRIVEIGEPTTVGQRYLRVNFEEQARYAAEVAEPEPEEDPEAAAAALAAELEAAHGEVLDAWFEGEDGRRTPVLDSGTPAVFCARVRFDGQEEHPEFTVTLRNSRDVTMFAATSFWTSAQTGTFAAGEEAVMRVRFENILAPDRYRATVGIARPGGGGDWICRKEEAADVQVTSVRASGALVEIPYAIEVERQAQARTDPVAR